MKGKTVTPPMRGNGKVGMSTQAAKQMGCADCGKKMVGHMGAKPGKSPMTGDMKMKGC